MKTIIEPFRTKMVEPIRLTTQQERQDIIARAGYNLFKIDAADVTIDLLTDSGTAAMSAQQWSALMQGDESYAGSDSFKRFYQAARTTFGFEHVIPVHQGRAAERLFFGELVTAGHVVPSNRHFDTTRANIEARGATALDLPCLEMQQRNSNFPFKGNIDLSAVEKLLSQQHTVPFGMITLTNNAGGGQPASLKNLTAYSSLLHKYNLPLLIDAARFAENAYLIRKFEQGIDPEETAATIALKLFALADGCLMSAKKDGLANTGGFIALRDGSLAERLKQALILTEGFPTYGGLAGRDLETIAVGLHEVIDEQYLEYRHASARYLANGLKAVGVPVLEPVGLHAVYIDAGALLPHIPAQQFPGQALVCELYLEAGVRACEIGSAMFDASHDHQQSKHPELVRLALPRRVYSQSHYDYVIEAAGNIRQRRDSIPGIRIVSAPAALRHFSATFEPVPQPPAYAPTKVAAPTKIAAAAGSESP